jgi:hypothetical protein
MALVSYLLGRRHYPVPYEMRRIAGYIGLGLAIYFVNAWVAGPGAAPSPAAATLSLALYLGAAYAMDGRRLRRRSGAS